MPTLCSLNTEESSRYMSETIQLTLMTEQGGPTGWPPNVQEAWARWNTSRNALDEAIDYARRVIGSKKKKEEATPASEEEYRSVMLVGRHQHQQLEQMEATHEEMIRAFLSNHF